MAQDRINPDEEYKFSDYENSSEVFPSGLDDDITQAPQSALKRNLLVGISIIAVIVVVYKLLGFLFTPKSPGTQTARVPAVMQLKPPSTQIPQTVPLEAFGQAKPARSESVSLPPPSVPTEIKEKLDILQQESDAGRSQLGALQTNLTQIDSSITSLNQKIRDLDEGMRTITERVESLRVKPKPSYRRPGYYRRYYPDFKQYYLQAVLPGRAWLLSKNGTTITVKKGTLIPGYGYVVRIDTQAGNVVTSSGMIIKFRPSDL